MLAASSLNALAMLEETPLLADSAWPRLTNCGLTGETKQRDEPQQELHNRFEQLAMAAQESGARSIPSASLIWSSIVLKLCSP